MFEFTKLIVRNMFQFEKPLKKKPCPHQINSNLFISKIFPTNFELYDFELRLLARSTVSCYEGPEAITCAEVILYFDGSNKSFVYSFITNIYFDSGWTKYYCCCFCCCCCCRRRCAKHHVGS